jgi:hypothetical protein
MKEFLVYAHYTVDTNELFYIGKGDATRMSSTQYRNRFWHAKVKKYGGFKALILAKFAKEEEALACEVAAIGFFGRRDLSVGPLVNLTDGGEGISGLPRTKEHNLKIGKANKGQKRPSISAAKRGKKRAPFSEEHRARLAEAGAAYWAAKRSCP